ncbi:MAG: glycosyltransferase family 25 protein [Pseudomonadota bacterium]|nr:glycosyltransferase family 25 protein [Pseudomonadota bacterium]
MGGMGGGLFERVFTRVCHVKNGYEDRERHIRREFSSRGVPVDFYLDFDADEIEPNFAEAGLPPPIVSLGMKHHGIWRDFLASGLPYCLVFEDDVFLAKDFVPKLSACIDELGDRNAVVYLGNAGNYYIPYFQLRRGQHLYPARHGRCTDSYLITRPVAAARLAWFEQNRMVAAMDHQIDAIDTETGTPILWFERPIVVQGTHTGAFASSLGTDRPRWQKQILWHWKKSTRQLFGRMR